MYRYSDLQKLKKTILFKFEAALYAKAPSTLATIAVNGDYSRRRVWTVRRL